MTAAITGRSTKISKRPEAGWFSAPGQSFVTFTVELVECENDAETSARIQRRYSEFAELHTKLVQVKTAEEAKGADWLPLPALPPTYWFGCVPEPPALFGTPTSNAPAWLPETSGRRGWSPGSVASIVS